MSSNSSMHVRRGVLCSACAGAFVLAIAGAMPALAQQKAASDATTQGTTSYTVQPADNALVTANDFAEARLATDGLDYMKTNCTMCHSVPTPSAIAPMDKSVAEEFLSHHMIESDQDDVDAMLAYFYPEQD